MPVEIMQANSLRLRARIAIRTLNLNPSTTKIVQSAIGAVEMPLYEFDRTDAVTLKKAFITKVLGNIGNKLNDIIKTEVNRCLTKKL